MEIINLIKDSTHCTSLA